MSLHQWQAPLSGQDHEEDPGGSLSDEAWNGTVPKWPQLEPISGHVLHARLPEWLLVCRSHPSLQPSPSS